jgi:hypothetical protein
MATAAPPSRSGAQGRPTGLETPTTAAAVLAVAHAHGCSLDRISVERTLSALAHPLGLLLPPTYASCCDSNRPLRYGVWDKRDEAWERTLCLSYERLAARSQRVIRGAGTDGGRRRRKAIPRILHHIWLGPPCPPAMQQWMREWPLRHPGWQHVLWDDAAVAAFGLANAAAFHAAPNFGEKSDIARYEILDRFGYVRARVRVRACVSE